MLVIGPLTPRPMQVSPRIPVPDTDEESNLECESCGAPVPWTEAREEWQKSGRRLFCESEECQP